MLLTPGWRGEHLPGAPRRGPGMPEAGRRGRGGAGGEKRGERGAAPPHCRYWRKVWGAARRGGPAPPALPGAGIGAGRAGPGRPGAAAGAAMWALRALCLAGLGAALGGGSADQCSWRGR